MGLLWDMSSGAFSADIRTQGNRVAKAKDQLDALLSIATENVENDEWVVPIAIEAWKDGSLYSHPRDSHPFSGWIQIPDRMSLTDVGSDVALGSDELIAYLVEQLHIGLDANHALVEVSNFSAKRAWSFGHAECENVLRSRPFGFRDVREAERYWNGFSRLKMASLGNRVANGKFELWLLPYYFERGLRRSHQPVRYTDVEIFNDTPSLFSNAVVEIFGEDHSERAKPGDDRGLAGSFLKLEACILESERNIGPGHRLASI